MERRCSMCGFTFPLNRFYVSGINKKDGETRYYPRCKKCHKKPSPATLSRKEGTPNRFRVVGDVAYIELTDKEDRTTAEAIVSAIDIERIIAAGRWHCNKRRHTSYVSRSYRQEGKPGVEWLHRFIMQPSADLWIDHINRNGLDNRRENLRVVVAQENAQNTRRQTGRSGIRNIHWDERRQQWTVRTTVKGKLIDHGHFDTIAAAAEVAKKARRKFVPLAPENQSQPSQSSRDRKSTSNP